MVICDKAFSFSYAKSEIDLQLPLYCQKTAEND